MSIGNLPELGSSNVSRGNVSREIGRTALVDLVVIWPRGPRDHNTFGGHDAMGGTAPQFPDHVRNLVLTRHADLPGGADVAHRGGDCSNNSGASCSWVCSRAGSCCCAPNLPTSITPINIV